MKNESCNAVRGTRSALALESSQRPILRVCAEADASSDLPSLSVDLLAASYRSDTFPADWSAAAREQSLLRYRKWLGLIVRHPRARMAPTADIDQFWHLHMLSPVAYVRDCTRLFGHVLDHDGGFGKGEGEIPVLKTVFEQTASRWELAYGEPYREDGLWMRDAVMTNCWHDCSGRCWHDCSSKVDEDFASDGAH